MKDEGTPMVDEARETVGEQEQDPLYLSEEQQGILIRRHRRYLEAQRNASREADALNEVCTLLAGEDYTLVPTEDGGVQLMQGEETD